MALYDQAQHLFDCIPLHNRDKLDTKVDAENDGVQLHLGEIASAIDEWQVSLAHLLGLSKVDIAGILSQYRDNLPLQTRAALQKWQEKNGFKATYRCLIEIFLKAKKYPYAEAVCRVLGGDPSKPAQRAYTMPVNIGNIQGTRLRVNTHFHKIYMFLGEYTIHWRDIGLALGFSVNELNSIQSNQMLFGQGPSGYLSDMLNKWLQWAPRDGRGSTYFATFEALREALLNVSGTSAIAYDLGQALGIQGPAAQQPTQQPPSYHHYASMPADTHSAREEHHKIHANVHVSASVPTGMNYGYPHQSKTLPAGVGARRNTQPFSNVSPSASLPKGGSMPPPAPGDIPLTMGNHFEITRYLNDLELKDIVELGGSLGLSRPKLGRMTSMPGDMVAAWLRQEDYVITTTGDTCTWRTLASALDSINQGGAALKIRNDKNISKHDVPQGPLPPSVEETTDDPSEEQVCAAFMKKLEHWRVSQKDRKILNDNGITSDEALDTLHEEDLKELKLSFGGKKILKAHLKLPDSPPQLQRSMSSEPCEEDEFCSVFYAKLLQIKVMKEDRKKLKENGILSMQAFGEFTINDLKEIKISLGGRKLLGKLLSQCTKPQESPKQTHRADPRSEQPSTFHGFSTNQRAEASRARQGFSAGLQQVHDMTQQVKEQPDCVPPTASQQQPRQAPMQGSTSGGPMTMQPIEESNSGHMAMQGSTSERINPQLVLGGTSGPMAMPGGNSGPPTSQPIQESASKSQVRSEAEAEAKMTIENEQPSNASSRIASRGGSLPTTRVTPDHSDPDKGKREVVMDPVQNAASQRQDTDPTSEFVVTKSNLPDLKQGDWVVPLETDSDGVNYVQSYEPYPRVYLDDRTMKHKPKLKLHEDPKTLTTVDTDPIQYPNTLVGNYPMKSRSKKNGRGLALIINNEKFADPRHKQRKGTYRDEYNLVETFRFLGYRVKIRRDCMKEGMERMFDDMDNLVDVDDDSFVCCILSHGSHNIVYGSDSEGVVLKTRENSLEMKLSRCEKLAHKPKLFFISTCRKVRRETDGPTTREVEPDDDGRVYIARADFAFNFATLAGEEAWRYTDTGTFYVMKLCEVLCRNATRATLSDIQKKVAQEVGGMDTKKQMPTQEEQTTKNVYFFDDFFSSQPASAPAAKPLPSEPVPP